jgi:hypothetical protein
MYRNAGLRGPSGIRAMPAWDLTRSDYEQMTTLRGQGLRWSVISARMGRSEGTLRVMFSRYRRGQIKAVPSNADRAVEAFEANPCPIPVIATAMGLSPRQVRNLLYRRGYDAEVRNELSPPAPSRKALRKPKVG